MWPATRSVGICGAAVQVLVVTASCALADTLPIVAVTPVVPRARPLAAPLLTDAMPLVCVAQAALALTSAMLPSENVPVAVKCRVMPTPVCSVAGAMTMDWIVAAIVFKANVPLVVPDVAVIVVVPSVNASARPLAAPMSATAGVLDVHVTASETSAVWPSAKVPVALKRCEMPSGSVPVEGAIAMAVRPLTNVTRATRAVPICR